MIISKPHAHLKRMYKTFVKYQKNPNKTAEGVAHIRYILLSGNGRTDIRKDGKPKPMFLRFSSKRRGTIMCDLMMI